MTSLTVSPRMLQMVGKSLYKENPAIIVTRELVQNSRDACSLKGGDIIVTIDHQSECTMITCEDTGIGMDLNTLESVFLSLGSTFDASGGDKIGGFGIAKASIFAADYWSIHTREWYIDSEMLISGINTCRITKRTGTVVTCKFNIHVYYNDIMRLIAMLQFSELPRKVKLYIHLISYRGLDVTWIHKPINLSKARVLKEDTIGQSSYKVYLIKEQRLEFGNGTLTSKGIAVYRLGGLVQYVNSSYGDRKTNIIVDVNTSVIPGDKGYPFTMSRESICEGIGSEVNVLIEKENQNALSSQHKAESQTELRKFKIYGDLNHPERIKGIGESIENSNKSNKRIRQTKIQRLSATHRAIVKVWSELLDVLNPDEAYWIAYTDDEYKTAARATDITGIPTYIVNPFEFSKISDKDNLILALWHTAIHELAHMHYENHNEYFTSEEGRLSRVEHNGIFTLFQRLARITLRRATLGS